MTWHANYQMSDGSICHLTDAEEWRHFDTLILQWIHVMLGWFVHGWVSHCKGSIVTHTLLVILTSYNLPLGMCMSSEYMFLTMVIPGPSNLKHLIEVCLEPLIEELQNLWLMHDSAKDETFTILCRRAMTITYSCRS
ncbi:UNVERIFIED_CONTAM: hypothetical protein Sangu_0191600 [Sesamum angustifolium]|uniref:Uncharacterized protein n=1 Tax=Sesamum angustifolium TaxID=2727405 RepID=A0AAW2RPB5_9LAMI